MTPDRWARAPWHARQAYLGHLDRLIRERRHELATLDARAHIKRARAEDAAEKARRVLDRIGPDPDADKHRADLLAALDGAA